MRLDYRGIELWDSATGAAIAGDIGDEPMPPVVAAATLGTADPSPVDMEIGLALLTAAIDRSPDLQQTVLGACRAVASMGVPA